MIQFFFVYIDLAISVPLNESKLRTHLNITKNEFRDKCNAKNTTILKQLKEYFNNFKDTFYEKTKTVKLERGQAKVEFYDDMPANLIRTHCSRNKNVTEQLERMFDLAQTCLGEEESFNELEKQEYLRSMRSSTCSFMMLASKF